MYEDKPPRRRISSGLSVPGVPYAAWVWVPFYNRIEPALFGIPVFLLVADLRILLDLGLHRAGLSA